MPVARWLIAGTMLLGVAGLVRVNAGHLPVATHLTGHVATPDNQPVRRAHVTLTGPATVETEADADGNFSADLAPGSYSISAAKSGYVQREAVTLDVGANPAMTTIPMLRGAVIAGTVVDQAGVALPDVPVSLGGSPNEAAPLITTDDRGVFRFHTLRAGSYILRAPGVYYRNGTDEAGAEPLRVGAGETIDVQIVIPATASSFFAPVVPPRAPDEAGPTGGASISGRVTSADTGGSVAQVIMGLSGPVTRHVETAADGTFTFEQLPAGRYTIEGAATRGYAHVVYGQDVLRAIVLAATEQRRGVDLHMPPLKSLGGRIVDEFGDPAPDTLVVLGRSVDNSPGMIAPLYGSVTNDLGEFRVSNIAPGTYVALAVPALFGTGVLTSPTSIRHGTGFAITFFPGTTAPNDAQPIVVDVHGAPSALTFSLIPTETGEVTGQVRDPDGTPNRNAIVTLIPVQGREIRMLVAMQTTVDATGTFTFKSVPPGSYAVQGYGRGEGLTSQIVTVAPRDQQRVDLKLMPPARIQGRLIFDGAHDAALLSRIRIAFRPIDLVQSSTGGVAQQVNVNADGTFDVPAMFGVNRLVFDMPDPWTLIRVSVQGRDITDQPLDAADGDRDGLEVLLASRASHVTGTVVDSKGQPAPGAVLIVPERDDQLNNSRYLRVATADEHGEFTAFGLPPGSYRAVALAGLSGFRTDPEYLRTLRARGQAFNVNHGETVTLRLTLGK